MRLSKAEAKKLLAECIKTSAEVYRDVFTVMNNDNKTAVCQLASTLFVAHLDDKITMNWPKK